MDADTVILQSKTPASEIPPGLTEKPAAWSAHMKWMFHGLEGTKEEICEVIRASAAPDFAKDYLCAFVNSREGRAFNISSSAAADHAGELTEHTRVRKIY